MNAFQSLIRMQPPHAPVLHSPTATGHADRCSQCRVWDAVTPSLLQKLEQDVLDSNLLIRSLCTDPMLCCCRWRRRSMRSSTPRRNDGEELSMRRKLAGAGAEDQSRQTGNGREEDDGGIDQTAVPPVSKKNVTLNGCSSKGGAAQQRSGCRNEV
jgi:hypothetical protein